MPWTPRLKKGTEQEGAAGDKEGKGKQGRERGRGEGKEVNKECPVMFQSHSSNPSSKA
jgi:hypothetical protein